jgi:hypothetical protein
LFWKFDYTEEVRLGCREGGNKDIQGRGKGAVTNEDKFQGREVL